jgi:hypothetical protein
MNEDPATPTTAASAASRGAVTGDAPPNDSAQPEDRRGSVGLVDRPAGGAANQTTTEEDVIDLPEKVLALEFEVAKSIRYHAKRCAFFETLNHVTRALRRYSLRRRLSRSSVRTPSLLPLLTYWSQSHCRSTSF